MKIDKKHKVINAVSQEFPLKTFYGNTSPQAQIKERPCIRLFPDLRNGFNNESPDFFRMDSMKENITGYKNPYLNVVKTLDRSLFYKNNQSCIDHINMINKIKSKKELSQNPKILKQLAFSTDINKLENKLHKESKITPYLFKTINSEFGNPEYLKKIKMLNGEYCENNNYITKGSLDVKKIQENQFVNSNDKGIKDDINNYINLLNYEGDLENNKDNSVNNGLRNIKERKNTKINIDDTERGVENSNQAFNFTMKNNNHKFNNKFGFQNFEEKSKNEFTKKSKNIIL